jgi:aminopeptidase N
LENQTLIGHSGRYLKTAFGWNELLNHEFAHEWFANQMSNANYDDLWLHEGLGTYAAALLAEYLGGDSRLHGDAAAQRNTDSQSEAARLGEERAEKEVYADTTGPRGDIYPKGSWVAHTLRKLIGDEAFFTSIRTWCTVARSEARQLHAAVRHDAGFLQIVNRVTGKDTSGSSTSTSIRPRCPR